MGGIIEAAHKHGFELVPTVAAAAYPSGPVTAEAFELFSRRLLDGIEQASRHGGLDGVLLSLHGAMVTECFPDGEGELLRRVRGCVGHDMPVVSTLDFHANMTEAMVSNADILVGYNTYPHVDGYERGLEAGQLLWRMLADGLRPASALCKPRLLPPLVAQRTEVGAFRTLFERAHELEQQPQVLEVCTYGGFPYADIEPAGMGVLVVTDSDPDLAQELACQMEELAYSLSDQLVADVLSPEDAVRTALASTERPIVLADVADNPGAGGSCDGTGILEELIRQEATETVLYLADGEAAAAAHRAGVGETITVAVGGKRDRLHGKPITVEAYVKTLSDGSFTYRGPIHTGLRGNLGRAVVLEVGGVTVLVGEHRVQTTDPEIFRFSGIEPTHQKLVVLKSSVHYRAAFEPLAAEIIEVAAPGVANPDLTVYNFKNVRRPIFPLDELER